MGYILRDIYFSEMPDQTAFQRHQKHLETWLANLPGPLRQQTESGLIGKTPQDQYEAAVSAFGNEEQLFYADASLVQSALHVLGRMGAPYAADAVPGS